MKRRIVLVIALLLSAVMVFGITAGAFDANDYDYSYDGGGSDWAEVQTGIMTEIIHIPAEALTPAAAAAEVEEEQV